MGRRRAPSRALARASGCLADGEELPRVSHRCLCYRLATKERGAGRHPFVRERRDTRSGAGATLSRGEGSAGEDP
jgi:hypothetical protein